MIKDKLGSCKSAASVCFVQHLITVLCVRGTADGNHAIKSMDSLAGNRSVYRVSVT